MSSIMSMYADGPAPRFDHDMSGSRDLRAECGCLLRDCLSDDNRRFEETI